MKLNVIKDEGKELVVEFEINDFTFPELLASKLLENDDVEFAGVSRDHPETGKPQLTIKTAKKKPADALSKALEDLEESTDTLKGAVGKGAKGK
ncbi:MAG: DNA-directed RNA polymerase subunit L [Candidatus Marsarchaeota archaeon]|nr:DNA-directed RNA polymerase subunit L [Candidatus Marsarchaeota archaeon]